MAGGVTEEPRIRACTVCRDVRNFDLLIEDMEAVFPESWGELTFIETVSFLDDPEAADLELLAIALDDEDAAQTNLVRLLIERAAAKSIRVILIAESLSPILLHQLLRAGADDFVPYPLPENALKDTIERMRKSALAAVGTPTTPVSTGRNGRVFAVQALAGGAGATTFAVNLAWELVQAQNKSAPSVCILDLDFQSGSVSTYLDLPRTEKVYEMLSQTSTMDSDAFYSALQKFQEKLHVLTAPSDMLPLDLLSPEEIERVIGIARDSFDIVVVDMPRTIVHWTETVLSAAEQYFAMMELDMRSAQNTLRLIRALKADGLSTDRFRFVLNRAPRFTDLGGRSRAKRMAESLGISIETFIPDGGAQVRDANDHGLPLGEFAPKNPAGKEIRKLAQSLQQPQGTAKIAAE
ncbi:AAA family ATPase [Roseinatronobacter alkalisoli]|uniref:AAA family ATPase n=1 Tax=Roseinatronobacter alkalisoli TaxID=3028235 RepID=A0ABT5TCV8_9RHOB|nr:AAA family ATPase [Roseinatronobacter sp. HJB301]MDD7971748.1 AAA family ATPase [Roseinatronobacter sp. HJB301]